MLDSIRTQFSSPPLLVLAYRVDVTAERLDTVRPVTEFAGTRYYAQWTIHLMTHLILSFKDGGLAAKLTENLRRVHNKIHRQSIFLDNFVAIMKHLFEYNLSYIFNKICWEYNSTVISVLFLL